MFGPGAILEIHLYRRRSGDRMSRGLDCKDEAHDDIHFSGADDQDLENQVLKHRDEYHQGMSDDEMREIVAAHAYDE